MWSTGDVVVLESDMKIEIGCIEKTFRYPVKSMGGERLDAVTLGWHGLDGDRRVACRRLEGRTGFPWLTATTLPDLIPFTPLWRDDGKGKRYSHMYRRRKAKRCRCSESVSRRTWGVGLGSPSR